MIDGANVELSLTVPITNSLAFLFTVLGEWWTENKVLSRGMCLCVLFSFSFLRNQRKKKGKKKLSIITPLKKPPTMPKLMLGHLVVDAWLGMALVLSGIALCVQSKAAT